MKRIPALSLPALATLVAMLGAASGCTPNETRAPFVEDAPSRVEQALRTEPARDWFVKELVAANVEYPQHGFGSAVAVSGITAVVTAPRARAAYVFVRTSDGWQEQAKLDPPANEESVRTFGDSVAISGDTIVVGAPPPYLPAAGPGAAYVYVRSGATWSPPARLSAADGEPNDGQGFSDRFGRSVAIDGDVVVVGAPSAANGGAAYRFTRSGSSFAQTAKLSASDPNATAGLGYSVAISGDTILAGAPWSYPENCAYVFTLAGAEQRLSVPGLIDTDEFGSAVALDENVAVIGAHSHRGRRAVEERGLRQGAAFVFTKSAAEWTAVLTLFAEDGVDEDAFGTSVAVSGNTIMVGAPGSGHFDAAANTVYLYDRTSGETARDRLGTRDSPEHFGASLGLDGDIAVVGTSDGEGAFAAEFLVPRGGACDEGLDCEDRHCTSGVCCDTRCSGPCETCASGACTPDMDSPAEPACAPYQCQETSGDCPSSCRVHADCADSHFCLDGDCVERLPNGEACADSRDCESGRCNDRECAGTLANGARCSSAIDCESGLCVDGYCCDQSCEGQCEACDVAGARGTCSPVEGAPRGERSACGGDGTACDGYCDGEHVVRCTYPTTGVGCGSACNGDGMLTRSFCNGQGECSPSEPFSCAPYRCVDASDESGCGEDCDDSRDCAEGFTCSERSCEPRSTCLDENTAERPDGTRETCWPYLCAGGRCMDRCEDARLDCASDSACDENQCVAAPPRAGPRSSESGCGCRLAHPAESIPALPLSALAALASLARFVRRTRRLRPERDVRPASRSRDARARRSRYAPHAVFTLRVCMRTKARARTVAGSRR